ncbi:Urease accessory protein UreH [Abditibacterium utsteinense]|uniref:Urease accessory protein UreH n=1 Tax=Abditibacterium utsteinense TaxID=1960156 RepID=A0A2S8SSM8_9BACT|nr:urease accessory protein UreD [Abditibacterium utsteinense]PQV63739.1 Urease accessory protein UreH [Abditibacterium utsteinense]
MANGHLFARLKLQNGATRLIEHRHSAPLKIARPFPNPENGGLEICVMDASPGLLSGDDYHLEWMVEAGAQARITTQGATRVHPAGHKTEDESGAIPINFSRQCVAAHVGRGARLELWPGATIPFRGANFRGETEIFLEENASFSLFECLSAGRVASGEAFEFEQVQLKTRISDQCGPLYCAQNRFIPAQSTLQNSFYFGAATHWANFIVMSPHIPKDAAKIAQQILQARAISGAASELPRGGVAVSMLGNRAHDLKIAALGIQSQLCFT